MPPPRTAQAFSQGLPAGDGVRGIRLAAVSS